MDMQLAVAHGLHSPSEHTLIDDKMATATVFQLKTIESTTTSKQSSSRVVSSDATMVQRSKRSMFSRLIEKLPRSCAKSSHVRTLATPDYPPIHSEKQEQSFARNLLEGYNYKVDDIHRAEYPTLQGKAYLDNAGTQLPAKSLIDVFANDLTTTLYGNPHTNSLPARNSSSRVAEVRRRALEFFHADPNEFDLVFVANASAAVKLVGEALRDYVDACNSEGQDKKTKLRYAYHKDAHNSLIGCREFSAGNDTRCFKDDTEVGAWLQTIDADDDAASDITLFAYPGQSNMTGRRLPLDWLKSAKMKQNTYTLLDAAGLATTKQLELSKWAPDFTAVSFYKIFGFPDLGALIVKKAAAHLLRQKKYFAGGTVDGVMVFGSDPGMIRRESIHEMLEEGTLPFHNIIALGHALDVHQRLFTNMSTISAHVFALTRYCLHQLQSLAYSNGQRLCEIYSLDSLSSNDPSQHGGTIAMNVYRSDSFKIPYRSVEQAADRAGIYLRSGAMCNPGGMATHLGWMPEQLEEVFEAGFRCSRPIEVYDGKWTGVVRVSFGAASARAEVDKLIVFLRNEYLLGSSGNASCGQN